ncbi:hypothetical protein BT63DRAFT_457274 [Microthyrium microscopicum]|uniref:C3H1-type domain-containing protein n=1 Tax=Microthyrium microscopicum TaxID=703497 RepID=A0A6A6U709_9PEZI|nr:hypothetical protein BT63DRAFT_457274 [Microthyrium microscopicum]
MNSNLQAQQAYSPTSQSTPQRSAVAHTATTPIPTTPAPTTPNQSIWDTVYSQGLERSVNNPATPGSLPTITPPTPQERRLRRWNRPSGLRTILSRAIYDRDELEATCPVELRRGAGKCTRKTCHARFHLCANFQHGECIHNTWRHDEPLTQQLTRLATANKKMEQSFQAGGRRVGEVNSVKRVLIHTKRTCTSILNSVKCEDGDDCPRGHDHPAVRRSL